MTDFVELEKNTRILNGLMQDRHPGLHTWCLAVGKYWKAIADQWNPDNPTSVPREENPNKHPAGFTKGPWVIDEDKPTMILDGPYDTAKEIIAQVSSRGNARLMRAAPELYDALEGFLASCELHGADSIEFSDAREEAIRVLQSLGTANVELNEDEDLAGGKA